MDRRKVLAGVAMAAAVAAALIVLAAQQRQAGQPAAAGELYRYDGQIAGLAALNFTAYYGRLGGGDLLAVKIGNATTALFLGPNYLNVYSLGGSSTLRTTYYQAGLSLCQNSTVSATVGTVPVSLTSTQCQPLMQPFTVPRTLEEAMALLLQLPAPRWPDQWRRAGTAQTPLGQATVYSNTTRVEVFPGFAITITYESQRLADGRVYRYSVQIVQGSQPAGSLTLTLSGSARAAELGEVAEGARIPVSGRQGGGLDLLKAAERYGMVVQNGTWPAAIVFFDLDCPYCAQLFTQNYTVFQGHRVVLVDVPLPNHVQANPKLRESHQRLRCVYQRDPSQVVPTLQGAYRLQLAGQNYTVLLPNATCPVDFQATMTLAALVAGGIDQVATPTTVVVYPNGTYTVVAGFYPEQIARALRG